MIDIPLGGVIPGTVQTNLLGRKAIVSADESRRQHGVSLETPVEIVSVYAVRTLKGNGFAAIVAVDDDGSVWSEVFLTNLTLTPKASR